MDCLILLAIYVSSIRILLFSMLASSNQQNFA